MPQALSPELVERCKALFYQGINFIEIAKETGVNAGTLRGWSTKQHWKRHKEEARSAMELAGRATMAVEVAKDLANESKLAKEALSDELRDQVAVLRKDPPKSKAELRNTPLGQGRTAVVKNLADAAAKVYGWDNQSGKSLVNVQVLGNVKVTGVDDVD